MLGAPPARRYSKPQKGSWFKEKKQVCSAGREILGSDRTRLWGKDLAQGQHFPWGAWGDLGCDHGVTVLLLRQTIYILTNNRAVSPRGERPTGGCPSIENLFLFVRMLPTGRQKSSAEICSVLMSLAKESLGM